MFVVKSINYQIIDQVMNLSICLFFNDNSFSFVIIYNGRVTECLKVKGTVYQVAMWPVRYSILIFQACFVLAYQKNKKKLQGKYFVWEPADRYKLCQQLLVKSASDSLSKEQ